MTKWFLDNLGLKLVSLFLAVILWFYGAGEENVEVTRRVPLKVDPPNTQMTVLNITPWEVEVTLVGPRNMASVLSSKDINAYHKLTDAADEAGEYHLRIKNNYIELPVANAKVQRIRPDVATVVLDNVVTERLAIEPDIIGEPATGYQVDRSGIQVEPKIVSLKGPSTLLKKMKVVHTESIDVVGRSRAFKKKVRLALEPTLLPVDQEWIDVFVPFKEEFVTLSFKKVALRVLVNPKDPYAWTITPDKVNFTLTGPKGVMDVLQKESILTYIDASSLKEGTHTVLVQLELPPNVKPAETLPQVELTLKRIQS